MIAAALAIAACTWASPGADPFTGDRAAAVHAYADIPADARSRLQQRIAARQYDDVALITRDEIVSDKHAYAPAITGMHFGRGRVCAEVSRAAWSTTHQERALIFCEGVHCIATPTVCGNVSRVKRLEPTAAAEPTEPLAMDPPGAGPASASMSPGEPTTFADLSAPGLPGRTLPFFAPVLGPSGRPLIPSPPTPVPEPAAWLLLLCGLVLVCAGAYVMRRRRAGVEVREFAPTEGMRAWEESGGESIR